MEVNAWWVLVAYFGGAVTVLAGAAILHASALEEEG